MCWYNLKVSQIIICEYKNIYCLEANSVKMIFMFLNNNEGKCDVVLCMWNSIIVYGSEIIFMLTQQSTELTLVSIAMWPFLIIFLSNYCCGYSYYLIIFPFSKKMGKPQRTEYSGFAPRDLGKVAKNRSPVQDWIDFPQILFNLITKWYILWNILKPVKSKLHCGDYSLHKMSRKLYRGENFSS